MKVSNLISRKKSLDLSKTELKVSKLHISHPLYGKLDYDRRNMPSNGKYSGEKLMWTGTVKKPLWDSSIIIQFPQHNYSGTTSAYNERQYFSYLSLLYMSETITDPLKEPCWVHTNWFVLQGMVTCFWDYNWESLMPSPTQRTGMKETPGTMSPLLSELSPYVQGHNSFAPHKLLAFVITHYTG